MIGGLRRTENAFPLVMAVDPPSGSVAAATQRCVFRALTRSNFADSVASAPRLDPATSEQRPLDLRKAFGSPTNRARAKLRAHAFEKMFRFLHAADVHLDSPLRGLARHDDAPLESIRGATREAFVKLIDLAIDQRVAFVLIAGDLYDGDWKDFSTGIFMSRQLGRLKEHGIDVYVVAGNHDAQSKLTKELPLPDNTTVLSSKKPVTHRLESLGVAIHGQSFRSGSVNQNLARAYPDALPGWLNIGLLHTSLDGREGHEVYAPCALDDLMARGYEYWALGHVHRREVVCSDPWVVFPGCTQGRHVRETGAKGCSVVTVEDGEVSAVQAHDLDVVRWACCEVDLQDVEDRSEALGRVRESLERALVSAGGRLLAARVRLEGATTIAHELAAFPERLEAEIRAIGAELEDELLWIEKVETALASKRSLDAALAADDALSGLLEQLVGLPADPAAHEGVAQVVDELRKKLNPDVVGPASGLDLDNPRYVESLVARAQQMLIGRLLEEGGER